MYLAPKAPAPYHFFASFLGVRFIINVLLFSAWFIQRWLTILFRCQCCTYELEEGQNITIGGQHENQL